MFSSRVPDQLDTNRLTQVVRGARAAGRPLVDLTITNPTDAGLEYPASMLESLADPAARRYVPHALGLPAAREAVALDYARRGIKVAPDRIVLTASTSEAYSFLFKLLCGPDGDRVMVPVPSYPLFDHLTRLDGVSPSPYPLEYHGRWSVDFDALDARWTDAVRAVLAVSPNNPTGSVLNQRELDEAAARCAIRDAALILDEVFSDYPLEAAGVAGSGAVHNPRAAPCLTFRLGGLSKGAGLPQVKLGWMAVDGPEPLVAAAMERLELIADTYLSVSTPVQVAAPALIAAGAAVRAQILERVRSNYASLRALVAAYPSTELLLADAGWSAVVRVASTQSEEEIVVELLEKDGIIVHPGFFFDFPHEAFLVVSLLPEPPLFFDGVRRMLERVDV